MRRLKKARDAREPLELDLPERKIVLKPDGTVDQVMVPERLDAHRLIEEFMILANVAAAETLEKAGSPLIYRVHDEPSLEKMRSAGRVPEARSASSCPRPARCGWCMFNRILALVTGTETRAPDQRGDAAHAGAGRVCRRRITGISACNLRRYAHFTSPIRRYADLIVHRALISALEARRGRPAGEHRRRGAARGRDPHLGGGAAGHGGRARDHRPADRALPGRPDRFDLRGAHRAGLDPGGPLHQAGRHRRGRLHPGLDAWATIIIAMTRRAHALVGERTGESWRLGDQVQVKLVEAAPIAGALRFEFLYQGRLTGRRHSCAEGRLHPSRGPRTGTPSRPSAAAPGRA